MKHRICGPLAASTLILLSACGGDRDAEAPEAAQQAIAGPQRGGTAVLAEMVDMDKPMPIVIEGAMDGALQDMMYMSLLQGAWEDGRVVYRTAEQSPMAIAKRYGYVGPDSSALRFHLRSDLRWSDGQPITAEDVVWTYRMLADPEVASPRQDFTEHLDSVVARNDSTVVFFFDRRYPEMLFHATHAIAPEHVYEGTPGSELRTHPALVNPANGNLVVSGPFQIGEWEKGQRIVLVPNPHFPVRPNLDRIVIRVIPEETTRMVELQTGGVDMMRPIAYDKIPTLRAQIPNPRFEQEEQRSYDYIAYNPKTVDAFADPEIRRALGLAIDIPGILRSLRMEEFTTPAAGPYSPIFKELYDPARMRPLGYDPERARQILDSKGWRDTDGDGIRDRNGKPLRFTLLTNAGNQRRADVSQIVQQQWKQIGVDARLQQLETNTFFDQVYGKEYEAALGGWQVATSADLTGIWGENAQYNIASYDDPRTFALFEQALAQPTGEQANRYWKASAERIVADQPYTWLYFYDTVSGVSDRLRGTHIDSYSAYQNAWEWWIPGDRQRGRPTAAPAK